MIINLEIDTEGVLDLEISKAVRRAFEGAQGVELARQIEEVARERIMTAIVQLDVHAAVDGHLRAVAMGHLRALIETQVANAKEIVDPAVKAVFAEFFRPFMLRSVLVMHAKQILMRAAALYCQEMQSLPPK